MCQILIISKRKTSNTWEKVDPCTLYCRQTMHTFCSDKAKITFHSYAAASPRNHMLFCGYKTSGLIL